MENLFDTLPDDTIDEIFAYIDCGSDCKALTMVSQRWHDEVIYVHPTADTKFANHLATIYKMYPTKPWDYKRLSANPSITWELVVANIDKPWDLNTLSLNPAIKFENVKEMRNKLWYWKCLNTMMYLSTQNKIFDSDFGEILWRCNVVEPSSAFTFDIVLNNIDLPWNWNYISRLPCITPDIINANINLPWNWYKLSRNKHITLEFIQEHFDKSWDWEVLLGENPNMTWNFIDRNNHRNQIIFYRSAFSKNPNLKWSDLYNNFNFDWDWNLLSMNPIVNIDIVNNHNAPWNWEALLYNPNISIDDIKHKFYANPQLLMPHMSTCMYININIVKDNPTLPWDWHYMSYNKNVTEQFVLDNIDKGWDLSLLAFNRNISFEFMKKHFPNILTHTVSVNPNITWRILNDHIDDKELDWIKLSERFGRGY